ncbi:hypothetical protein BGZ60DRAFT_414294 [Tricladium varicosporioides]|nr:hypothetical protein BGZ60DRAFT_414294 [Hymenoscyphus varicosporioides]
MALSLIIFFLITSVHAFTKFETNCSIPLSKTNYVSAPNSRGTFDILWSCLFTIFACTWTIQHLNVPEQREGRDEGWRGDMKWALKSSWTTTKWMALTVLAPELLLGRIWADLWTAEEDLSNIKSYAAQDGVPWTMTHSLFANMGGFVIRAHVATGASTRGSIVLQRPPKVNPTFKAHNPCHLTGAEILALRQKGVLQRLPYITKEELNDKSKSDNFMKIITIAQIGWLVVQVIARAARGLAISHLEIGTVAFAITAIILYCLNWEKPKGIAVPLTILNIEDEKYNDIAGLLRKDHTDISVLEFLTGTLHDTHGGENAEIGKPVRNRERLGTSFSGDFWGVLCGSLVFGGIHLSAWNFEFPSKTDMVLWRVSSLFCTVCFFTFAIGVLVIARATSVCSYILVEFAWKLVCIGSALCYIIARIILIVEIFRTLCFLPPSAYISTWASNIPHVF